jgi:hypothetical protein
MMRSSDAVADDGVNLSQWLGNHKRGQRAARCRGEACGGNGGAVERPDVAVDDDVVMVEEGGSVWPSRETPRPVACLGDVVAEARCSPAVALGGGAAQ